MRFKTVNDADFALIYKGFVVIKAKKYTRRNTGETRVNPKTAMQLMRHSDINLTMKTYSRSYRESEVSAIDNLPSFGRPNAQAEKLTGTDDLPAVPAAIADQTLGGESGENRLAICLATVDTFNQIQPDLTTDEAEQRSFDERQ